MGVSLQTFQSGIYTIRQLGSDDKKITTKTEKRHDAIFCNIRLVQLTSEGLNYEVGKVLVRFGYDKEGKLLRRFTEGQTPEVITLGSPSTPKVRAYINFFR